VSVAMRVRFVSCIDVLFVWCGVVQNAMSRALADLDDTKLELTRVKQSNVDLSSKNDGLQQRVHELEQRLLSTESALANLREQSGKGQDELRGLLADRDDKIGLLEGQLSMMEGANKQLGEDVSCLAPFVFVPTVCSTGLSAHVDAHVDQLTESRDRVRSLESKLRAASDASSVRGCVSGACSVLCPPGSMVAT